MKTYISPSGQLFAYESDGSQDALIPSAYVIATPEQIAAITNPPLSQAQQLAQYNAAIQGVLDAYAVTKQYDNMNSMVSYINSTNATFKADATAANAWRDAVWASAYATLAAVQAGTQQMPASVTAFLATLPVHP